MDTRDRILKLMEDNHITKYRLAKEIHVSSGIISDWANGKSTSYTKYLDKIADYFGVSVDYLILGEEFLNGVENTLESKMGGVSFGEDEKKKDFINAMLDLADLNDYEVMESLKNIAVKVIEANKKG